MGSRPDNPDNGAVERRWVQAEKEFPLIKEKLQRNAHDVLLCYNRNDADVVRNIAVRLQREGILPWFDEWDLMPSDDWIEALERVIKKLRVAAVLVGRSGLGPWQTQEMRALLQELVAKRGRVIPVLLPNARKQPKLPLFLRT